MAFKTCFLDGYNRKIELSECLVTRKGKFPSQSAWLIKAFETKLKLWQRQLCQNMFDHFPCLQSAFGKSETNSDAKYSQEIVKLQHEFITDCKTFSLENCIKMFSKCFDIDVESVSIDVQM